MFRLNGILYLPAIASRGLILCKAAIGTTKTERGVTYRLNRNHRWERVGHESPGQLSLLDGDLSGEHIADMQYAGYDEGAMSDEGGEMNVAANTIFDQYAISDAERAQRLTDWGTQNEGYAALKAGTLAEHEAEGTPAAFIGDQFVSVSQFGSGAFYVNRHKVTKDRGEYSIDWNGLDGQSEMLNGLSSILGIDETFHSRVYLNNSMRSLIQQETAKLAPSISPQEFESSWKARLDEPKPFLMGDESYPIQEWTPSNAAVMVFGAGGAGAKSFANGWSMSYAGKILGMSPAEIRDYYSDLSHRADVPVSVRSTYADMAQEVSRRL